MLALQRSSCLAEDTTSHATWSKKNNELESGCADGTSTQVTLGGRNSDSYVAVGVPVQG